MWAFLDDDKNLVILGLVLIACLCAMIKIDPGSKEIIGNIVSGLLGVAIGRRLKQ